MSDRGQREVDEARWSALMVAARSGDSQASECRLGDGAPGATGASACARLDPGRGRLAALLFAMLLLGPHAAATQDGDGWLDSGSERVALLELFSSEGCSSCPPAEKWLGELGGHPDLWKRLVPLNFHVTYWDRLGWPDRFASHLYTTRQHRYVAQLGLGSAYTPGFILNGREWRGFFAGEKPRLGGGESGRLRLRREDARVLMEFTPASKSGARLVLNVAILGFDLGSDVRAGENRGRRLVQNFVVLGLSSGDAEARDGRFAATLPLPLAESEWPERAAIAGWVEHNDDPTPLQAVGARLTRR